MQLLDLAPRLKYSVEHERERELIRHSRSDLDVTVIHRPPLMPCNIHQHTLGQCSRPTMFIAARGSYCLLGSDRCTSNLCKIAQMIVMPSYVARLRPRQDRGPAFQE